MGSSIYELGDNTALYEVLGVPRTATDKDIRRAYLKLVVIYHPDKNPDGEEIFKEICFAHSVLSDPKQRAMYDSKSLRQNLQGRANEYDPAMDPRVQLSPEDLRKFVEKIESEQSAKVKQQDAFERMREEEMRRRAEYDAKNPAFKVQYERDRKLRQQQASAAAAETASRQPGPTSSPYASRDPSAQALVASRSTGTGTSAGLKGYRTCAELTASLEEDERNRLYGLPTTSMINKNNAAIPASTSSSNVQPSGLSVRQQMMSKYRTEQAVVASGGSTNSSRGSGTPARTTKLDFVKEQDQQGSYVKTVDEAIRTYSHFDYLDYVTADRRDQEPIAGAVIADALDSYARKSEDPKALD